MNNHGEYPRARTYVPEGASGSAWDFEGGFWFNAIGPYLEEGRRFDQELVSTGPWPQNIPFASPSIDEDKHGWGGAGIDIGYNGYLFPAGSPPTSRVRSINIVNPSRALLAGDAENANGVGTWQIGVPGSFVESSIAFRHGGKANLLFVDGHVDQIVAEDLEDDEFVKQLAGK
ncbi:hypothetical protein QEH59_16220 [Coraliomargarita sp. SDUM461004]|uniref:DUF1559 domain-containing protein n=1 Tax=Thalassobacterium sedimentorum TaxID=3041258 RepID=A0ABU1AMP7_9BACT|nr:H-X9-DG-CTERM domain-containing protein [Coraliomargarita sp. SDUM461004]MDQ8195982.1 hypothetical protein [Coraliomargarita sp. SDUM461004]